MEPKPLERLEFEAGALIKAHPPQWHHRNKQTVYEIACSSGFPFEGRIAYARWPEVKPPAEVVAQSEFRVRPGVFEYARSAGSPAVAWHVNFADPQLFFAYSSSLLAQDELQVAEHPILGSLRDALISRGMRPATMDEERRPTPVTISGVERRCAIDTLPNQQAGRPAGLYGNAFARATRDQVKAATTPLSPPTISNILPMAAPTPGHGAYEAEEIVYVVNAAYTGFLAARRESEALAPKGSRTIIHTGFWGCGAFGGNRTLMTMLQALAADVADVDIVYWAFDEAGVRLANDARKRYERLRESTPSVPNILDDIVRQQFPWGVSDGN